MEDSKALVSQGVAGTGSAVIYDTNHFDPVKFAEQQAAKAMLAKAKREKERQDKNAKAFEGFNLLPNGQMFMQQLIDYNNKGREIFARPEYVDHLIDPTTQVGQQYNQFKMNAQALVKKANDLETTIQKELALAAANPTKYDPQSVDELTKAAQLGDIGKVEELYRKNGGQILKPAYDVEDLLGRITYTPEVTTRRDKNGLFVEPHYNDEDLKADIEKAISSPDLQAQANYFTQKFGGKDALVEELIRLHKKDAPEAKFYKGEAASGSSGSATRSSGGIEAVAVSDTHYQGGENGRFNLIMYKGKNGAVPPATTLLDENGRTVLVQDPVISLNDDDKNGMIIAKEAVRTGAKVTKEEAEAQGFENFIAEEQPDGEVRYYRLKDVRLPLTEGNISLLAKGYNINPVEFLKSMNNKAGKNKPKQQASQQAPAQGKDFKGKGNSLFK
jgi:hypothetical protein